jgi:colanic acid/amylovoran biosynthesis glycosyltransferase
MKIAYLINQYPQASQSFIRREIAALEAQGVEVDRFTLRTWDQKLVDPGDQAEKSRTRVVLDVGATGLLKALLLTFFSRPTGFFRALGAAFKLGKQGEKGRIYHLIYLAEACVLLGWLRKSGAQHVHAHFGTNSAAVALLVRELGGPPFSFTCHGPEEFDRPLTLKLREKIEKAQFVVAISQYGRSQLFRWVDHTFWSKIHVVHCGLDASFLDAPSTPLVDVPRLVCVGRLCEQKGQLLLIQAAVKLRSQGVPFQLVLAGDGPLRSQIEALIHQNKLGNSVVITGWLSNDQVREQILAARALVLPSFAEGLPVVVMEAMALRRPVLSTFVGGIPELVECPKSGYLIPAGSVDDLLEGMQRILQTSVSDLRQMGEYGAKVIQERHNAATEAQKLVRLFKAQFGDAG